jgi:hypothetical protein
MKRTLLFVSVVLIAVACQNSSKDGEKAETTVGPAESAKSSLTMPYTPTYSSNFTTDISDEHLKVVLDSYKFWEAGDFTSYATVMGDSVFFNNSTGVEKMYSGADLLKTWKTYRDSLSSVRIDMAAWHKMKSDKGHEIIATWYTEYDTYKTGKVDSTDWHDLNIVDSTGKIVWYSQYKKPKR